MSDENGGGETEGEHPNKDASSADSAERESIDEVPKYKGQWVALGDGESLESDGDSDGSGDSREDDSTNK